MRLQATMHYLLHNHMYIQICVYKGMHAYLCEEPKGDHCFIRRSKIVVQEMYGLLHISDFESIKCGKVQSNPNLLYGK